MQVHDTARKAARNKGLRHADKDKSYIGQGIRNKAYVSILNCSIHILSPKPKPLHVNTSAGMHASTGCEFGPHGPDQKLL